MLGENNNTNQHEANFIQARKDEIDRMQSKLIANHLLAIIKEGNDIKKKIKDNQGNLRNGAVLQNFDAYYLGESTEKKPTLSNIEGLRKTINELPESQLSALGKKDVSAYINQAKNKAKELSNSQQQMDNLTKKYLQVNGVRESQNLVTIDKTNKTPRSLNADEKNKLINDLQKYLQESSFDLNQAIKYGEVAGHKQAIDQLVDRTFCKYFTNTLQTEFGAQNLLIMDKLTPDNIKAFSQECDKQIKELVEARTKGSKEFNKFVNNSVKSFQDQQKQQQLGDEILENEIVKLKLAEISKSNDNIRFNCEQVFKNANERFKHDNIPQINNDLKNKAILSILTNFNTDLSNTEAQKLADQKISNLLEIRTICQRAIETAEAQGTKFKDKADKEKMIARLQDKMLDFDDKSIRDNRQNLTKHIVEKLSSDPSKSSLSTFLKKIFGNSIITATKLEKKLQKITNTIQSNDKRLVYIKPDIRTKKSKNIFSFK